MIKAIYKNRRPSPIKIDKNFGKNHSDKAIFRMVSTKGAKEGEMKNATSIIFDFYTIVNRFFHSPRIGIRQINLQF